MSRHTGTKKTLYWRSRANVRIREFKLHVYGKRKTSYLSSEFLKIENEQIKQLKIILMDKKLREATNLCEEIMNSKRQLKGPNLARGRNSRLPFDVNVKLLNLSIIQIRDLIELTTSLTFGYRIVTRGFKTQLACFR